MAIKITKSKGNKKSQTPILILLGVGLITAGVSIGKIISPKETPPVKEEQVVVQSSDMVSVPVPRETIQRGVKLRNVVFTYQKYPKQELPEGAIVDLKPYLEAQTDAVLPSKLPMFVSNLTFVNQAANPVVERIPDGMRAMTISVDATTSVEGWAGSGSIVDVVLIEKDRTTVIAEKVKILSSQRQVNQVDGAPSKDVPTTVTLLVSQPQCLAINTAIPKGRINFALRNLKDGAEWVDTKFSSEQLRGDPVKPESKAIKGFIEVKGDGENKKFVLTDGDWIKSEVKPKGFLVNQN